MRLSAKERTGLRAMVEFARRHGQGPVSLHDVAELEGLPLPYLEQVAGALRRYGLLRSVRGAHGGYLLTRIPAEISVGDIFRALEGTLIDLDCMGTDGSICAREPVCATRTVWQIVFDRLSETLDHTFLSDMVSEPALSDASERTLSDVCKD